MKIDFSNVKVYTDLGRETGTIQNLRKEEVSHPTPLL